MTNASQQLLDQVLSYLNARGNTDADELSEALVYIKDEKFVEWLNTCIEGGYLRESRGRDLIFDAMSTVRGKGRDGNAAVKQGQQRQERQKRLSLPPQSYNSSMERYLTRTESLQCAPTLTKNVGNDDGCCLSIGASDVIARDDENEKRGANSEERIWIAPKRMSMSDEESNWNEEDVETGEERKDAPNVSSISTTTTAKTFVIQQGGRDRGLRTKFYAAWLQLNRRHDSDGHDAKEMHFMHHPDGRTLYVLGIVRRGACKTMDARRVLIATDADDDEPDVHRRLREMFRAMNRFGLERRYWDACFLTGLERPDAVFKELDETIDVEDNADEKMRRVRHALKEFNERRAR